MKITINDIAKKAKVSKTTVSRYINGKYEFMSLKTRTKIEKIIKEFKYTPNSLARSLKNNNTKMIGCTIADIENQFSSYIFKGISDVCKQNGYRLLVTNINENEKEEIEAIESLLSYNVDGLIINTAGENEEYLLNLKKKNIPIVLADRNISKKNKIDIVTSDNKKAVFEAVKHLYEEGYEEIGFFTYDISNNSPRTDRYNSFLESYEKYYNKKAENIYIINNKKTDECFEFLKDFIENKSNKKAIFSSNGTLLIEILANLKKLNKDYEKLGIGICSFDDWGWSEFINKKGITTIKQQSYECGEKCANLLFELINDNDKSPETIELETELITRGSTKLKGI